MLLIPLDADARAWLGGRGPEELAGLTVAEPNLLEEATGLEAPGGAPHGWAVSSPLDHAVHDADVVVLFTHDLGAVDTASVIVVADTARASGTLLGALVVSPGARWEEPAAARAITTVREAVDNVVILKDDRFVAPFLQVLRGGVQDPTPDEVVSR